MEQFIRFFWIFMLGGFFGYLLETVWCMIRWKKFESRKGTIYGHFILIYALAALFVAAVVEVFKIKKAHLIFLATFFISGVVEYGCSLFQEKCMGTVSWNYSDMKFNLHGRINLVYLLGFGLFGILWCKGYPIILNFVSNLINNDKLITLFTMIMFLFMIYNLFISLVATVRQKNRRIGIVAKNRFEIWLDNKYTDEYLKKLFANAVVVEK